MEILHTIQFKKDFRKLSKQIQVRALERMEWFCENPFDSRLKTHPLKGKLSELYAFSVSDAYRILFAFGETKEIVEFYRIGKHDIYD